MMAWAVLTTVAWHWEHFMFSPLMCSRCSPVLRLAVGWQDVQVIAVVEVQLAVPALVRPLPWQYRFEHVVPLKVPDGLRPE